MPKDRRVQSLFFDRSRASPYPCSSSSRGPEQHINGLPSGLLEDTKEWEEARCPICLEHPHNVVLLQCSSSEKGCRPYMCDTSYRHSNCLDQFKTSELTPSNETVQENPPTSLNPSITREEASLLGQSRQGMKLLQPNLNCPLCRGEIYGYIVVDAARKFMNAKVRSCSSENCDFSGTYSELRKHARSDHPSIRPTEVDAARQNHWQWLERIRGFRDFISFMQPMVDEPNSENRVPSEDPSNFFLLFLGTYLIHEVEEYLLRCREELHESHSHSHSQSSPRSLRSSHNMETNHAPSRHTWINNLRPERTWINNLRPERTHYGRYNTENNRNPRREPRWNYNFQEERANQSRYNNPETNRDPRWNGGLHPPPPSPNNSQGLRWQGQRRRTTRYPRWDGSLHPPPRPNNSQGLRWQGQRRRTRRIYQQL